MADVSLLTEKMQRFGVVGAGVMPDSFRLAKAREQADSCSAAVAAAASETPEADAAMPVPSGPAVASKPPVAITPVESVADLTRQQVLDILTETARVQAIVQQEVSALARKLVKERSEKKKRKGLSFKDGHKKIVDLNLPREPLEDYGLDEADFQQHLHTYQDDEEVMECANKLLHPLGKGTPSDAASITVERVIEIHQFMVQEMQKVLQEFLALPQDVRRSFTGKACETTAELLVSIAVEQQMNVHCDDVEQAVIMCEDILAGCPEFAKCTEDLASLMQRLVAATQPRVAKADFLQILQHMAEAAQKAKKFSKKLFEDYRVKQCDIATAYTRFEEFSADVAKEAEHLPDLGPVEMQLCFDEYQNDPEVLSAWEQSGAESNPLMQAMVGPSSPAATPKVIAEERKKRKLKPSEIVEMQELMADELKRTTDAVEAALANGAGQGKPWKADVALHMVQSIASAAVERRYGISSQEMAVAGFQHAQTLQKNERFVRATTKQQEIFFRVSQICGAADGSTE